MSKEETSSNGSLQVLSGQFVGFGNAILITADCRVRLVLDSGLHIYELALVGTVVHHVENCCDFETFLH